jgi:chromosome segregation ATPase
MAEGNETPGGPPRRIDRDLLAERRARRAAPSGEDALLRRAETAEATVRTLETHLATLQRRLGETEQETLQTSEQLGAARAAVTERECELRRVRQREYAEQQLRIEAEDRCIRLERESRAEIDRLERRLRASERHVHELTTHLEAVQRELAETEQTLRVMHEGHAAIAVTVGELKGVAVRLRAATAEERSVAEPVPTEREPAASEPPDQPHREEMAAALAAAVERLRARAQEPSPRPIAPVEKPAPHKHSFSWLARRRMRRKQRSGR